VLSATCQQLSEQWAAEVERSLPPSQPSFLDRLMGRKTPAPQLA
jgi:hypothetical protein